MASKKEKINKWNKYLMPQHYGLSRLKGNIVNAIAYEKCKKKDKKEGER